MNISYDDLLTITELMKGFPAPWHVAGGWAIDLFVGRVTREHEDLEIGIARRDQAHIHPQFSGWEVCKIVPRPAEGEVVSWEEGEWLDLPIHQVLIRRKGGRPEEFQLFLNEIYEGLWHFRRNQAITYPAEEIKVITERGIPIIAPEIQLLYKARLHRPKDEEDFRTVVGLLDPTRHAWLRDAMEVQYPGDPWLAQLDEDV